MPLSDAIQKAIVGYSLSKRPEDMVDFLEEKLKESVSVQDILNYARSYQFAQKPGKPYVVNATVINLLGIMVNSLKSPDQKKFSIQFFMLAAERGSSWGNRNCVSFFLNDNEAEAYGVKKLPKKALTYAQEAVRLAVGNTHEEHEHKLVLAEALHANSQCQEANEAMIQYLKFKIKQHSIPHFARSNKKYLISY